MSWRVAHIRIPYFEIRVSLRGLSDDERARPIALVEANEHARVRVVDQFAAHAGVRRGQTASQARACCPDVLCVPWMEALIEAEHTRITGILETCSPGVNASDKQAGSYWLDARGMAALGGETALADRVIQCLQLEGYPQIRVGVSETCLGAQAASLRTTETYPVRVIAPGRETLFLETLSLDELPIDNSMRDTLQTLGLTQVSELLDLPKASLTTRFGAEGQQAFLFAQGVDHRRVEHLEQAPSLEAVLVLDEPVTELGMLIFGLRGLAMELAQGLNEASLAVSSLALCFSLDDHRDVVDTLVPTRPIQHPDALFELVRQRLERRSTESLSSPIVELKLLALETVPSSAQQVHIGLDRWDAAALEGTLDRLHGRFGVSVVFEAVAQDELRAEHVADWSPVLEVPLAPPRLDLEFHWAQGVAPVRRRIRTPPQIHVREGPLHRPSMVRWRGDWQRVDARGPERISGRWWSGDVHAYEDYRAVLASQEVLWLRRDARTGLWSLQGWFD